MQPYFCTLNEYTSLKLSITMLYNLTPLVITSLHVPGVTKCAMLSVSYSWSIAMYIGHRIKKPLNSSHNKVELVFYNNVTFWLGDFYVEVFALPFQFSTWEYSVCFM